MKASEVLRAGLAKLDGGKAWIKGMFGSAEIGFCSSGALLNVDDTADSGSTPYGYLLRSTGNSSGRLAICEWNDAPERTFADVEAAFQKAIALAEKDEQAA